MANTNLYNLNSNRDYPFVRFESFIPVSAIVSCGFILGPSTGFVAGEHSVYLSAVSRDGSNLYFDFQSDAPGLSGRYLRFARHVSDPRYLIEYSDSDSHQPFSFSTSLSESDCGYVDDFLGYLVTGELEELVASLADDQAVIGRATVEPSLLQVTIDAFARSVNVSNGDRTRYESSDGCRDQCWPFGLQAMYVQSTCLSGPLRFKPGYNCAIRQNVIDNSLTFDATVGAGLGEVCAQPTLFDGETTPDNSNFLEGGPGCGDVVRSINGIGGRMVSVLGGLGVSVTSQPSNSRLVVDVNTHDMVVCADATDQPTPDECPEESLSASECDCGPV